jgi:hypothetical protein
MNGGKLWSTPSTQQNLLPPSVLKLQCKERQSSTRSLTGRSHSVHAKIVMRTAWGDWPYPALKVDKMGLADQISAIALSIFWLSQGPLIGGHFICCKVRGNIPDKVGKSSMVKHRSLQYDMRYLSRTGSRCFVPSAPGDYTNDTIRCALAPSVWASTPRKTPQAAIIAVATTPKTI